MTEAVTVHELGHGGDGIAEAGGARIFVPFTLAGETVEIERTGNRAAALNILAPSPVRVAPICRHFGTCGGCALQHMERGAYLDWKREIVRASFALHGIDAPVEAVVAAAEPGGRRRAVFSAVRTNTGVLLGFHRRHASEIVALHECPVLAREIATRLKLLGDMVAIVLKPRRQARVTVLAADNGLDIAITGAGKANPHAVERLAALAADPAIARLSVDDTEVIHNRRPEIAADGVAILPPPGGFVQASAAAEAALATAVGDHVGEAAPVADLFAGVGTFSLRLARRAAVTAVESDPALIEALTASVHGATGLKRVTAVRRDLFANPLAEAELDQFGAVVFDPPAVGARRQAEAIARSQVPKVAAVSCNPATLARDARILIDGGYRMVRVVPVDQFLFSAEIEAVATFER